MQLTEIQKTVKYHTFESFLQRRLIRSKFSIAESKFLKSLASISNIVNESDYHCKQNIPERHKCTIRAWKHWGEKAKLLSLLSYK